MLNYEQWTMDNELLEQREQSQIRLSFAES